MEFNKDDTQDFAAFKSGDDAGYVQLFRRFYQPLCLFALQFKINKEDAEEVVQDVLHQLRNKKEDFDSLSKLASFLYVSTRNATFNRLDRNNRQIKNQARFYLESETPDVLNAEQFQKMVYAETIGQLHEAFKKLPSQCAKVMTMLYLEGHTVAEVVEQLQITASTVYVQKKKGIDYLKEYLKPEDYFLITLLLSGFFKIN
ncbi:MAG: sigma-70 family RNA polymerase sigma factor [Sphingobacterium sp.]|jgi:RNA polymerase sigma-70 factor (ECF subfamily)|nr:sigma-70 family RNA polymerase sigma factor [Sphingobacterium sp.]